MKIYDDITGLSEDNAALKNILGRTSVRQYKTDKMPDKVVSVLLHAAMSARQRESTASHGSLSSLTTTINLTASPRLFHTPK